MNTFRWENIQQLRLKSIVYQAFPSIGRRCASYSKLWSIMTLQRDNKMSHWHPRPRSRLQIRLHVSSAVALPTISRLSSMPWPPTSMVILRPMSSMQDHQCQQWRINKSHSKKSAPKITDYYPKCLRSARVAASSLQCNSRHNPTGQMHWPSLTLQLPRTSSKSSLQLKKKKKLLLASRCSICSYRKSRMKTAITCKWRKESLSR